MRNEVVEVDFIFMDVYSSILARSWLLAIGAVSYTLHVKVKYPTEGHLKEFLGCQIWQGSAWS